MTEEMSFRKMKEITIAVFILFMAGMVYVQYNEIFISISLMIAGIYLWVMEDPKKIKV